MRVTFAAVGWEQLAIGQLSAILKEQGHTVNLAFSVSLFNDRDHFFIPPLARIFDDRQRVIDAIKQQRPDVLAFSIITSTYQWALSIAKEAKEINPNIITVFGGVHSSGCPDRVIANPQVDIVCIGEGDLAFPQLLKALENGGLHGQPISNLMYKMPDGRKVRGPQDGFVSDLDSLPIIDKTIWEEHISQNDSYLTMASRGCPYRCTFCFNSFFANLPEERSGYIRQRSVDHVMYELNIVKKRYNPKLIKFYDDVFILNKKWLNEFCDRYGKEIKIPFQCELHANYMNDHVGLILANAGCIQVDLGVQSALEDYKRKELKRSEKNSKVAETLDICRKYRIKVNAHMILSLPGEALEAQEIARKLYIEHPPTRIDSYFLIYFPGTEIFTQAVQSGVLTKEEAGRIEDGLENTIAVNPNKNTDKELLKILQGYQLVYRLIPNTPRFLRQRLDPKFFSRLPNFLKFLLNFFGDVCLAFFKYPQSFHAFLKHILYHICRPVCEKWGIKVRGASKIYNHDRFSLTVPAAKVEDREFVELKK
jgi:radical SAM superfamily enzyme YgiQ (UPF0313 family)